MALRQAFEELVAQLQATNFVDSQDDLSETAVLKRQLDMLREVNDTLKSDINQNQEKMLEMQNQLETSSRKLDELEFKLKLTESKAQLIEDKYKHTEQQYSQTLIQEKVLVYEVEVLTETNKKLSAEKNRLFLQNAEMQEKFKALEKFKIEVGDQQADTLQNLKAIKEQLVKYENEHLQLQQTSQALDLLNTTKNKIVSYEEKIKQIESEREDLQNQLIMHKAKNDKLQSLMACNNISPIDEQIIKQYQQQIKLLTEKSERDAKSLKTMNDALVKQININKELLVNQTLVENNEPI